MAAVSLRTLCGSLVIGGFTGTDLPRTFSGRLASGELGGAILFAHNITADSKQIAALCGSIARTSNPAPIVSVDQEGGRVARIKDGVIRLPSARRLGALDDAMLERVAATLGTQLAALGFSLDYAPVVDVHTNENNPVIGDRAFGSDPETVSRAALMFARGLGSAGIAACAKHFPGHGDTHTDSHVELPRVTHDRARLDSVEIEPFRRLARDVPAMMSAHVVYDALDPLPATLSHRIASDLLRGTLGFEGVLISDDLEMRAIANTHRVGEAAVLAVEAGCDALLVCSDEAAQIAAVDALTTHAESSAAFRVRCEEAHARLIALRRTFVPRPVPTHELAAALAVPDDVQRALESVTRASA